MPNRYVYDPADRTTYANGAIVYRTPGPFASIARVENVPCAYGKRRTFHTGSEPDTVFSIPGWVYVKGKTVAGFLTFGNYWPDGRLDFDAPEGPFFLAYLNRRNAHLLPGPSA